MKLKVINKRIDATELDIMKGIREGAYVSDLIDYRQDKIDEAKYINKILNL